MNQEFRPVNMRALCLTSTIFLVCQTIRAASWNILQREVEQRYGPIQHSFRETGEMKSQEFLHFDLQLSVCLYCACVGCVFAKLFAAELRNVKYCKKFLRLGNFTTHFKVKMPEYNRTLPRVYEI